MSGAESLDVAAFVSAFRGLRPVARKGELQRLIGHKTDEPSILHRRALLVTALRQAGVYPGDDA